MRHADRLPLILAASQVSDTIGNELVPRRYVDAHLDHLGVPRRLRPVLPAVKVASSVGLMLGRKSPRLGAASAAGVVAFYAAAVTFHALAGDHPVVALPAAALGVGAAAALVTIYLPAVDENRLARV